MKPLHEKYILLESLEFGSKFFTTNTLGVDHTRSGAGEKWYKIVGYANSVAEAQIKLYGKAYPL